MILIERELLIKKLSEIQCLLDEENEAYIPFSDVWHLINQIPSVDEISTKHIETDESNFKER